MRVRFLGDGDLNEDGAGKPCVVFGQSFPVGEWVETRNAKLADNPMFEAEPPKRRMRGAER
jgi:hypothetical protein